jgi:signal transduction histidine kinase/ActR/RegA family two-component response regulator
MHWPWQQQVERWEREREVYARLGDVILVFTLEGRLCGIVKNNEQRHPLPSNSIGKYLRELFGVEQGLKAAAALREAIGQERRSTFEYQLSGREGAHVYRAELIPLPRTHRGREERVLWVAHQITAAREEQAGLWMRNELLEGMLRARTTLMAELPAGQEAQALNDSLRVVGQATHADRVYILEHYQTPYYKVLSLQREWCAEGISSQLGNPSLEQIEYEELLPGWLGSLIRNGYKYFDVNELPEAFRAVLRVAQEQWVLLLPVFRKELLWGVMGIEFHRPHRRFGAEEIAILQSVGASIGGWIGAEEAKKELTLARLEAEKANKAKSEFLAVISHELRTPMNAILGYSQLLRQTISAPEAKEQLGFIEKSGRGLLDLINNILDFSKIESNAVELEAIPFVLEQTVYEAIETCQIKAREKGLVMDAKLAEGLPERVVGDPHRLKQILVNLLNNAVKFTSQGGVYLELGHKTVDERFVLHGAVRDTGIGISADKASRLFRPFSQADSSTTRQYGGTGLGLAIAKRLVERMGGKIWVESQEGQGSVFHFTLQLLPEAKVVIPSAPKVPLAQGAPSSPAPRQVAEEPALIDTASADGQLDAAFAQRFPLRLLVVEDDPLNQRLLVKILERLGYRNIDLAADGQEGLQKINQVEYQAVITDLQMPRMDGIAMTTRLRQGECGPSRKRLPVIALTAYALEEQKERCVRAGVDTFLQKPIQIAELKESLITAYHQVLK